MLLQGFAYIRVSKVLTHMFNSWVFKNYYQHLSSNKGKGYIINILGTSVVLDRHEIIIIIINICSEPLLTKSQRGNSLSCRWCAK